MVYKYLPKTEPPGHVLNVTDRFTQRLPFQYVTWSKSPATVFFFFCMLRYLLMEKCEAMASGKLNFSSSKQTKIALTGRRASMLTGKEPFLHHLVSLFCDCEWQKLGFCRFLAWISLKYLTILWVKVQGSQKCMHWSIYFFDEIWQFNCYVLP